MPAPSFTVLDFETANVEPSSACAIGIVRVEDGRVVARVHHLIRPPRQDFCFTHIHGITWSQVAGSPGFGELWPVVAPLFQGADFLAAHNAGFDRNVLAACSRQAGLGCPALPWLCTVRLARRVWKLSNHKLPTVCGHLGIPLCHHEALSDAEACANIVLHALATPTGMEAVRRCVRV